MAVQDKVYVHKGWKALALSNDEGENGLEAAKKAFGNFCPEDESEVDEQAFDASDDDMGDGEQPLSEDVTSRYANIWKITNIYSLQAAFG